MISDKKIKYSNLANFRFTRLNGKYLLTTDTGRWIFLEENEFEMFLSGEIKKNTTLYKRLDECGFIKTKKNEIADYSAKYLKLNSSLSQGPSLFIFVLTLQCNHRCLYCQVTPEKEGATGFDMSKEVAKKSVDLIFRSPSPYIGIEFQGGEPLLNWSVLQYIVKYAKAVNKTEKKELKISLVTNLTRMDDNKLAYLIKEGVSISCSFDGPDYVHNKNRIYLDDKNGSYKPLVRNMKMVRGVISQKKQKSKKIFVDDLNAILTTTRFSLSYPKEIVDEYLAKGFNNVFIRPLSPFGLQRKTLGIIGYSAEEYIAFYEKALDYILELNLGGTRFIERTAYLALKRVLNYEDSSYYEMRSPCGAGIGQMAFDYNGNVYTCDEGRMAERMGHDNFKLGSVHSDKYVDVIDNEVTRTMCLGSSLDNQAGCNDCVYKPYCGICPLANFIEHGTIFPQILNTDKHKINKALFDYLFNKISDEKYKSIFESWLA
ncbi:MAG: His-Xaa-Ser system radical SAM maturase HxsB [Candidatus Moranbacteria bacterium]|nr:His-Xaa-Ser system radical SAM maturase HxsB [Candidatus Moranbacteria bacterium]